MEAWQWVIFTAFIAVFLYAIFKKLYRWWQEYIGGLWLDGLVKAIRDQERETARWASNK